MTRGRYNRPEVANVPSGPSLDSSPPTIRIKKKYLCKELTENMNDGERIGEKMKKIKPFPEC
jgi:hypothetical protein